MTSKISLLCGQSIDADGNMTSKSEGSNFWRYSWDYENRMAEAATRKTKVRYRYDALGRRVARNLGGGRELTKFTYDGDDVLVDDNFGTLTKYLNGAGIDNKLRQTTGSTASYFLTDHLGSTNGLVNSIGSLTASNSFDSFGNPTNPAFPSRYQFTGREFDSFSGLQFSRARWYDPNLGRFISEDPIGFRAGDINLYGYVKNNALNRTDPTGLIDPIVYQDPSIYPSSFRYNYGCPNSGLGIGAISDFMNNYSDMRLANTVGADKFFHCMANCQAGSRGSIGTGIARTMSEGREIFDEHVKGDPPSACNADRFANNTGLSGGRGCRPCQQVCSQFRPTGLTYPVPRQATDPCQGYGNWSCK